MSLGLLFVVHFRLFVCLCFFVGSKAATVLFLVVLEISSESDYLGREKLCCVDCRRR